MDNGNRRLLTAAIPRVAAGQIWRERAASHGRRYVLVLFTFRDGRVQLCRCKHDGSEYFFPVRGRKAPMAAPHLETNVARFADSGSRGFILVQDVQPALVR